MPPRQACARPKSSTSALEEYRCRGRQAYLALASARERIAASQASVEAARRAWRPPRPSAPRPGDPLEIIDAQVAYSNAELQAVEARYDYYLACAQLDRAIGRDWQNGTP